MQKSWAAYKISAEQRGSGAAEASLGSSVPKAGMFLQVGRRHWVEQTLGSCALLRKP